MRELTIKLTIPEGYDDVHPDIIVDDFIVRGDEEIFKNIDIEVIRDIEVLKEAKG